MALKNQALTIKYKAYSAYTGLPVTGDVANHTIRVIKDGVSALATNTPTEASATNVPGTYLLALTADEMNGNAIEVEGKSSTSGVVIIGREIITEQGRLDTNVGSRSSHSAADAAATVWAAATRSLTDKTGFALTADERLAIAAAVEVDLLDDMTNGEFMQAIADKLAAEFDIENLTIAAIASAAATATRDAILNRVLDGNHDLAGTLGLLAQKLNVSGTLAHSDDANTYKATGFATPTNVTDAKDEVLTAVGTPLQTDDYTAPDNTAVLAAIGSLQNLSSADIAAALTEFGVSTLTAQQVQDQLNANTGIQRLQAVPGEPEAPVFIIPAADDPGLVNVLCRSGSFGVAKNGTTFGFEFATPTEFVGDQYQVLQRKTGTTSDGECLIAVYPSRSYHVWAGPKKLGTVTVPANGGLLKEVNGTLTIEEVA